MNKEARQLKEIRARLADNFRDLGNDEWRGQYRRDVITLLSLLDQPDGYARAKRAAERICKALPFPVGTTFPLAAVTFIIAEEMGIRALAAPEAEPPCFFCDRTSAYHPADFEQGAWVHRGRDNEVEFCTNPAVAQPVVEEVRDQNSGEAE